MSVAAYANFTWVIGNKESMARTQAADYDDKRESIKGACCKLFAQHGFHATSISEIAQACNISKSNLYHYFGSKERILFEILQAHALLLVDLAESTANRQELGPQEKLREFASNLLEVNVNSREQHTLILTSLDALAEKDRKEISDLLRQPIEIWFDTLRQINPVLDKRENLLFPTSMMLIGMINWTHTWFSQRGEISVEEYASLICDTFLNGFVSAKFQ